MGYSFPGAKAFAERVAKDKQDATRISEVERDEHVRRVADLIGNLAGLAPGEEKARRDTAEAIEREINYHEHCLATIEAMKAEAFPKFGVQGSHGINRMRAGSGAISGPAPSAIDDDNPYEHEQPTGPDGRPLTLDPKNPEHQQYLDRVPKYGAVDSGHLARMQANASEQERAERLAQLHRTATQDRDLIGPRRPPQARADLAIDPAAVDADYDRWAASAEGQAELAAGRQRQRREAIYAIQGADVGMGGDPPRADTGVNQDFNQRDVPTMFDEPDQTIDPFQVKNPPYTEPNETDGGSLGPKRPQGINTGSGVTPQSMAAQSRVAAAQAEPALPLENPDVRGAVPPEAQHPELGGGKPKGGKGK